MSFYFHDEEHDFYKILCKTQKTINTYCNVNGFAKNKKESTMVIAFLPVVTAEEKILTSLRIQLQQRNITKA